MRGATFVVAVALLAAAPEARAARAVIKGAPPAETPATTASFAFRAEPALLGGFASFRCRLDGAAWERCLSPRRYEGLTPGAHTFEVRATGFLADPAPARHDWLVVDPLGASLPDPPRPRPGRPRGRDGRRDAHGCAYGANRAGSVPGAALARGLRCLINRERRRHGLRPLRRSRPLDRAAGAHARDMVAGGYFAHAGRSGETVGDRVRRAGYLRGARWWHVGEVLARGSGRHSRPVAAVRGWMRSPGHRAVLLTAAFRDLGLGVADGQPLPGRPRGGTFVGVLGRRR